MKKRVRIDSPCLLLFLLAALLMTDSSDLWRWTLAATLLHESGHVAAYWAMYRAFPVLEISVRGICLLRQGEKYSPKQTLLLAAAGPLANLAAVGLTALAMEFCGYHYGGYRFLCANLLVAGWNLLPVGSLDGAVLLRQIFR